MIINGHHLLLLLRNPVMQFLKIMHFTRRCRTVLSETLHIMLQLPKLQFRFINGVFLILDHLFKFSHFMVEPCQCSSLFLQFAFRLPMPFL